MVGCPEIILTATPSRQVPPLQCSHLRAPGDRARPTSCLFRILKPQTGCGCLQPQKPCFCDACRCLQMPAARKTLTLSMPTDACRCLQLAKPSHCQCLQLLADAYSSQDPHTANACRCLQLPKVCIELHATPPSLRFEKRAGFRTVQATRRN